MAKIVWSSRALTDLEDIGDYISKDSIKYAKHTLTKILNSATIISTNPLLGRIVPEANDKNIREIFCGNYRVIYQIAENDFISVLTVFHTSRLLTYKNIK